MRVRERERLRERKRKGGGEEKVGKERERACLKSNNYVWPSQFPSWMQRQQE